MEQNTFKILLETPDAIIVDKPAGWLAVPGRDPKEARPVLGRELEKQLGLQIFPIHRLDAEVSGVILYGKTAPFHREANALFENKKITKTYQALTPEGAFGASGDLRWESKILRGKKRAYEAPYGKDAITLARLEQKIPGGWEWRLNPITGRAHQLRFELYKRGIPIWGDTLYGSTQQWPEGIALRALQIEFPTDFAEKWGLPTQISCLPLQR